MTISLYVNEEYVAEVGTNSGWRAVTEVLSRKAREYPDAAHFARHGWSEHLPAVQSQIQAILNLHFQGGELSNPYVTMSLLNLHDLLDKYSRDPEAVGVVTDGVGVKDDNVKGGPGSGNFGHRGRPGHRGGSGEGGGSNKAPDLSVRKLPSGGVIGSKEAIDEWAKGSYIQRELYHYTPRREEVIANGFRRGSAPDESADDSIYFSSDPEETREYGYGKEGIAVKIKVQREEFVDFTNPTEEQIDNMKMFTEERGEDPRIL